MGISKTVLLDILGAVKLILLKDTFIYGTIFLTNDIANDEEHNLLN